MNLFSSPRRRRRRWSLLSSLPQGGRHRSLAYENGTRVTEALPQTALDDWRLDQHELRVPQLPPEMPGVVTLLHNVEVRLRPEMPQRVVEVRILWEGGL